MHKLPSYFLEILKFLGTQFSVVHSGGVNIFWNSPADSSAVAILVSEIRETMVGLQGERLHVMITCSENDKTITRSLL